MYTHKGLSVTRWESTSLTCVKPQAQFFSIPEKKENNNNNNNNVGAGEMWLKALGELA